MIVDTGYRKQNEKGEKDQKNSISLSSSSSSSYDDPPPKSTPIASNALLTSRSTVNLFAASASVKYGSCRP